MDPYIRNFQKESDDLLTRLRERSKIDKVPIVCEDTASLLRFLVKYHKPSTILEAGTAIGFSSILMAKSGKENLHIDTVEIKPDTAAVARKNIEEAGLSDRIRVIVGDASEVFSCLSDGYDMIFIDSAKGQYIHMYDDIKNLLLKGSLLVCDNIIFHGKILNSPERSCHKHRTIIANMRSFLEKLFADKDYTTILLEIGDGVTLSYLNS